MPSWKGKTRGGLTGYKIFIFILKNLGIKAAYFVLKFVVVYFIFFAPNASISILNYFRQAHKFNFLKSFISVIKNYFIFGQTIIDKIALISGIKNSFTYTFIGEEYLLEMKDKGGILISGHLGSWDIAGHFLKRLDIKINIVMFEAEHEKIKNYLSEVMGEKNWKIIPIKNDLSHIFQINSALSNNEIICIHGDRFVEGSKVLSKEFFGKKAYLPYGPFAIAAKLKSPYSFVYCVKSNSNHYNLYATPLEYSEKDVNKVLNEYVRSLEAIVKKFPYQWFNYYDFWNSKISNASLN